MQLSEIITSKLSFLEKELLSEMIETCTLVDVTAESELIKTAQYIKQVPIVLEGIVKVMTHYEDREYLLYYIKAAESCVMSMSAAMKNQQSLIQAIAETDATLLLIPSAKIQTWINKYPHFNHLFYQQYEHRYEDLLQTVHHLLFDKLDKRIVQYLQEKADTLETQTIKISHRQIALELGTAREVVTRIMKKLEKENFIHQLPESMIKIIQSSD